MNQLSRQKVGQRIEFQALGCNALQPEGRTIFASGEFARRCPSEFVPIGEFVLRGFGSARAVFGLADEGDPS